jgi:organic hydroperoxide reductase OsmC/OhrA
MRHIEAEHGGSCLRTRRLDRSEAAMIDCETERPNEFLQVMRVRAHALRADVGADGGSNDAAPSPHDYFDAALAACKTLTATWYAKKNGIPLAWSRTSSATIPGSGRGPTSSK